MNRFFIAVIVTFCASPLMARSEPARCIADWSVAARIVQSESLTTVEDVTRRIHAENAGNVVKTVLCERSGSYVYRLTVKEPTGALKNMTVDARSGR